MIKSSIRIQSANWGLMLFCLVGAPSIALSQIDFQEIRDISAVFPEDGIIETVDIDQDDDVDILVLGRSIINSVQTPTSQLFLNDGAGNFTEMENIPFDGSLGGGADFGDVDSDGDLDVIIVGMNLASGIPTGKLYINENNSSFSVADPNPFPAVLESEVEFFDFNGDPHLDVFISGSTGSVQKGYLTKIFIGDGQGNFQEAPDMGIDALKMVEAAFGDVDNDGIEELVLAGLNPSPFEPSVYIYSKENGKYIKGKKITNLAPGDMELADFDYDGDLDVLVGGTSNITWYVEYFLNDGAGNFTKVLNHPFVSGARNPKFVADDFDLDGDLDVFISGGYNDVPHNFLYLNDGRGNFTINDYPFPITVYQGAGVGNFDGKGLYDFIFFGEPKKGASIYLNNIELNTPPVITMLEVTGEPLVNYYLNASYVYQDKEGGQDQSSVQWFRADDESGTNKFAIEGAIQKEYRISALDEGKFLVLEVTPNDGEIAGPVVQSYWRGPITLPVPKVLVSGNSIPIVNGDMETSIDNHTHFGGAKKTSVISEKYILGNNGKADLIIGDISLTGESWGDFSVIKPEALPILPGGQVEFSVEFSPKGLGNRTAIVSILSNDPEHPTFTFKVSGEGLNSRPVFNSVSSVNIGENTQGEILDINSTDGEGGANDANVTYTISGGEDKEFFNLDAESGILRFISSPDHENPMDLNRDNEYIIEVTANDGGTKDNITVQIIRISVTNVDELPIAICKAGIVISLDASGKAEITGEDLNGGSSDDIGILDLTVEPSSFTCINLGAIPVTLTVTDSGYQSVSCTTTITLIDESVPVVSPVGPVVVSNEVGKCSASILVNAPKVLDNCGDWEAIGIRSDNLQLADPFPIGETFITWTTDASGNVGEKVMQSIIVIDSEAPAFAPVQPIFRDNDSGSNGAVIGIEIPMVNDCSGVSLTGTRNDGKVLNEIFPVGETIIVWEASDGNNEVTMEQSVVVRDVEKPIIAVPMDISVVSSGGNCGSFVKITSPLVTDNCAVSTPALGIREDMLPLEDIFPVGETRIRWTAVDINNNEADVVYQTVKVSARQPDEIQIKGPETPQIIGTPVEMIADFTDDNFVEANWKIKDGSIIIQEYSYNILPGTKNVSHVFEDLHAGVYTVSVTMKYECGKVVSKNFEYVVIYDPNGGFVTGGGWIYSPAGAMHDLTKNTIEGKANFGFNAKYKSGKNQLNEVGGETNFQFKAGDLYFKSSSHEVMSLVVSGGFKATYKGQGEINGEEGYNFMVTVIDADQTQNYVVDRFRIKIWRGESVIYDNNINNIAEDAEPATAIGGGSIVIHKPNVTKASTPELLQLGKNEIDQNLELFTAYPNPMESNATIEFRLNNSTSAILSLYDINGREILRLFDGSVSQETNYKVVVPRINIMGGTYFYRLTTGVGGIYQKQLIIK